MYSKWMGAVLSGLLLVSPLWAGEGNTSDKPVAAAKEQPAAVQPASGTTAPAAKEAGSPAPAAGYGAEIEELRQMVLEQSRQLEAQRAMVREQQSRLEALTEELRAARTAVPGTAANPPGTAPASAAGPGQPQGDLEPRVAKVEKDIAAAKKETTDKIRGFGPFSFSGDFRLRDEPFFGGPTDQSQVRNRERFRLRFNVTAKLDNGISGGFSVASGDINDPVSTNQTTNQFYTRKPFLIDRAFISYTPRSFKPLSLTGGKFAYPWYRTELTWDNDLNPEGLAQTLAWDFKDTPVLKRFALVGFELPFAEVAGVPTTNKSIVQSVVYGGQLQAVWQLGSWLKLSTYGGFYNYHNADAIAFALATASASNPQSPAIGLLKLGGASVQNSMTTITKATVVTADVDGEPTALPTGVTSIQSAQFASKFGLFDGIARFDIKTPYERWPIVVLGDYVQNTRACANVPNIPTVAPENTSTATFTLATSAACDPHQRRGYWLESRFGRTQEKGDWQFAYTRMFIEREAVMGAFNFSDLRQNSNVTQHRLEATYQVHKNIQLAFTGLFGRPLASTQPLLKRLQFDVIYKF